MNDKALEQEPNAGHCKDCKYFEYDSVAKVDGVPLIVAHEICSRWGDGCKTKEDGYCFLFEPKEGHWIKHDNGAWWECSKCHAERAYGNEYCPDCGSHNGDIARMVEPQESEDKE